MTETAALRMTELQVDGFVFIFTARMTASRLGWILMIVGLGPSIGPKGKWLLRVLAETMGLKMHDLALE